MAVAVANPYLDEVVALYGSSEPDQWKRDDHLMPWLSRPIQEWPSVRRHDLIKKYGFAVPTPDVLDLLARHAPLVELGAGMGYWAYLLRQMNVDIVAYDKYPPTDAGATAEPGNKYGFSHLWTEVLQGDERIVTRYPDRTLMLVWPSYNDPWADRALAMYRGSTVIYVGEGDYGCTADDAFHDRLEREWDQVTETPVYQWDGLHDWCYVYSRKAGRDVE